MAILLPSVSGIALRSAAGPAPEGAAVRADAGLLRRAELRPGSAFPVIIRETRPATDSAESLVRRLGGRVSQELPIVGGFSARLPGSALGAVATSDAVSRVWSDLPIHMAGTKMAQYDWGEPNTAWRTAIRLRRGSAYSGRGVTVALLDTGVAHTPDLWKRVVARADLTPDQDGVDGFGHGTHMAGIIAGNGSQSGGRWAGVAPQADIVSVKVARWDGSTDVSVVIAGLQWVVWHREQYDIRVLNLSFGTDAIQSYLVDPLDYAVERVWASGVLVVVAAGNRGPSNHSVNKPGDDPFVLTVGAADLNGTVWYSDDTVARFSSRGATRDGVEKPDLLAPGVTIVSIRTPGGTLDTLHPAARVGTSYFKGTGTSQATAMVSGVAALVFQADPQLSPDQAKALLVGTARAMTGKGAGAGLVRAGEAIHAARSHPGWLRPANRGLTPSTGSGSLEGSRGSLHVYSDPDGDGKPSRIIGEIDARGHRWDADSWDARSWEGGSWQGGGWSGTSWTADSWDADSWDADSWDADSWDADSWDGDYWG